MDVNADGMKDILTGSFSGVPQWVVNSKVGYGEPTAVVDKNGDLVVLSTFWDFEADDWAESDRSGTTGFCSSVAAVDWDHDGDMDLLLGGYREGGLFLRLNEGSATETKFATTNQPVKVGDQPIAFEGGIGAPRVVDWDGDGLFDIVIGSIYGEVVLFRNTGTKGSPKFSKRTTLVELLPGKSGSKQIKRVQGKDGAPVAPGSSFHIELVDYDGDDDLDLLVGGRSEWLTGPEKSPTAEDLEHKKQLIEKRDAAWAKFRDYQKTVTGEEALKELKSTEKYRTLLADYHSIRREAYAVTADPVERGDFLWLFRRK